MKMRIPVYIWPSIATGFSESIRRFLPPLPFSGKKTASKSRAPSEARKPAPSQEEARTPSRQRSILKETTRTTSTSSTKRVSIQRPPEMVSTPSPEAVLVKPVASPPPASQKPRGENVGLTLGCQPGKTLHTRVTSGATRTTHTTRRPVALTAPYPPGGRLPTRKAACRDFATEMFEAIRVNDTQKIGDLLATASRAQLTGPIRWEASLIHAAINAHSPAALALFLSNSSIPKSKVDGQGLTPAMLAITKGDYTSLQSLLAAGVEPNERHHEHGSLLHMAVAHRQPSMVSLLCSHRHITLNYLHRGISALTLAIQKGSSILATTIVKAKEKSTSGLNVSAGNPPPLMALIEKGDNPTLFRLLLENGANPRDRDINGDSPAKLLVVKKRQASLTTFLNSKFALPFTAIDAEKNVMAHIIVLYGTDEQLQAFASAMLERDPSGGDLALLMNVQNASGMTPLMLAAMYGREKAMQLILAHKPSLHITHNGNSALYFAVKHRHYPIAKALIAAGAEVSSRIRSLPGFVHVDCVEGRTPRRLLAQPPSEATRTQPHHHHHYHHHRHRRVVTETYKDDSELRTRRSYSNRAQ